MLRDRESWKGVVINWFIMILLICPLFAALTVGVTGILTMLMYHLT